MTSTDGGEMTTTPTKGRRRFLWFSLGTLVLGICVVLGWTLERVRKQGEVVAWVQQWGGTVEYDYFYDVSHVRFYRSDRKQLSDVTPLAGLTSLTRLGLEGTQVSDVTTLAGLTSLVELNLRGTRVSQEDYEMFDKMLKSGPGVGAP